MTMSLKAALRRARELGLRVELVYRTGEVRVIRPDGRPLTINNRRKDAPKALEKLLRDAGDDPKP